VSKSKSKRTSGTRSSGGTEAACREEKKGKKKKRKCEAQQPVQSQSPQGATCRLQP
jgi:hypothetical protein